MERHWHEVLIQNDEGDISFVTAAPLLVEALQLIASLRALPLSLNTAWVESELTHLNNSRLVCRVTHEEVRGLQGMLTSHLESVYSSLSSLQSVKVKAQNLHSELCCREGLIIPRCMNIDSFLESQPVFNYKTFRAVFERLWQVTANPLLFSACEPRIKVLQSRYRLFRAFNGVREDAFHPTLGGGSFHRAPKLDMRRSGTCMSAKTLVDFMQATLAKEPEMVLSARSALGPATSRRKKLRAEREGPSWRNNEKKKKNQKKRKTEEEENESESDDSECTLKEIVDIFFGPSTPPEERYFTADGLGLLPNYTEAAGRSVDDFEQEGETTESTRAHVKQLLKQFLDISFGNEGELFARLVLPMLSNIVSRTNEMLELEFTVTGHIQGEIAYIASWCVRSGLLASEKIQISLRIVQTQFCTENENENGAKNMEEVLQNLFYPIWFALLSPQGNANMVQFLRKLSSVVVAVSGHAGVQEIPLVNEIHKYSAESGVMPPDMFFIYHIWRNVQVINCMTMSHLYFSSSCSALPSLRTKQEGGEMKEGGGEGENTAYKYFLPKESLFLQHEPILKKPLLFRLGASATSKNSFMESVMGLLVADEVMNPVKIFEWSPLSYLYYLTQRRIIVTPSRNFITPSDSAMERDVSFIVQTGLRGSIATLDPLHHNTSDNAFSEELHGLQKRCNLALAEITELCLNSAESANWSMEKRCEILGCPLGRVTARFNEFTKTQVNSLRLHFRETSLAHEMNLLCRKGLNEKSGFKLPSKQHQQEWVVSEGKNNINTLFASMGPDYASSSSPLLSTLLNRQRETLWRFFQIPTRRDTFGSTEAERMETTVMSGRNFVDRQVCFPRIIISGPDDRKKGYGPQSVTRALLRRQYYQRFNVHYEPPLKEVLSQAKAINALHEMQQQRAAAAAGGGGRDSSSCKESIKTAGTDDDNDNGKADPASYNIPSRSIQREKQIDIPKKFLFRHDGVLDVVLPKDAGKITRDYFCPLPTWNEFQKDTRQIHRLSFERSMQRYAAKRLGMLECKFNLHVALTNDDQEQQNESKTTSLLREKGDLYKCVKVDVHCHMAAGMTAKELLSFIKEKVQHNSNCIVDIEAGTGRFITLGEAFAKLQTPQMKEAALNVKELTVASLKVKAGKDIFNRFDEFNGRYNPLGNATLRSIFLKTDNFMRGRYFAELIRQTFNRQAEDGYTFSEYRLSIYGRRHDEWDRLSRWAFMHRMLDSTNRWMIQIPRLYFLYRKNGIISSFQEMLSNIFVPIWEASMHPERYPFLSYFLTHVSGFDSVDNESEREGDTLIDVPPEKWTSAENPPFAYWIYYMWANIVTLNRYRAARGLSTFSFRPHAGESGDPLHMADVFLLADGVNHGINLKDSPVLQYLYYLAQIPLGITPLSNNSLFCRYDRNPFPLFFKCGLNVSLATDGALIFHHTEQPLIEEYGTAANFWNLSMVDVCEIAKNSVLMSGFPSYRKKEWLGVLYPLRSAAGNDVNLSKVPQTRCTFRYEVYMEELNYLQSRAALDIPLKPVMDPHLEGLYSMDAVSLTRDEVIERRLRGQAILADESTDESKEEGQVNKVIAEGFGSCITAPSRL